MKTTKLLPVFTKSTNVIVILMMVLSQFSWGVTRAAADVLLNPPVITEGDSVSVSMSMNATPIAFGLTLHATDAEDPGDTLTWSISTQASHGMASASGTGNSKDISYIPNILYAGSDSFVVQVDDGYIGADTITVNVILFDQMPIAVAFISQDGILGSHNGVTGFHWPEGAQVTLTITGPGPDYTETQTSVANINDPWDTTSTKVDFQLTGFTVSPGQFITMTDTITTKTLTVSSLTLNGGTAHDGRIWGRAEPGTVIQITKQTDHNIFRREIASAYVGNWEANFLWQGDETGEDPYVIQPGDVFMATQNDFDHDHTQIDWRNSNPWIHARPSSNFIQAFDWPNGTLLTLTINDSNIFTATVAPASWDPSQFVAQFDLGGFDLQAGDKLFVTDGLTSPTERTYYPNSLAVTSFDLSANTVSGTAADGEVHIWINGGGPNLTVPVTGGHWTADFSPYDIVPGTNGSAQQSGSNGSQTWSDWQVPNPHIDAWFRDGHIVAYDWPVSSHVTLTINDPATPENPDYTAEADMGAAQGESAEFNLNDTFVIQPGMMVTVSGASLTKSLVISNLTITSIDQALDMITGGVEPNQTMWMNLGNNSPGECCREFDSNGSGVWSVDYSQLGPNGEQIEDIRPGLKGIINVKDNDGDNTSLSWSAPIIHASYLKASASANWVHAYGWQDGDALTLVVDRPGVGSDADYTTTATAGQAPWDTNSPVTSDIVGVFDLGTDYNLQPGDELTVSGAGHTETYTVPGSMTQVRWFIGLGTGSDSGQIPVEQQVMDDFNIAHAQIEMILEVRSNDSARDALLAEIAAGNGPDIIGPVGWSGSNSIKGMSLDLDPLLTSSNFDTSIFSSTLMNMYHTDEGQVGLPFAVYPSALWYNPALFDAAGLHYPPAHYGDQYQMPDSSMLNWSWETLTQVAKLLTLDSTGKNSTQAGFDRNNITQYGFSFGFENSPSYSGSYWHSGQIVQGTPGDYTAVIPEAWKAAWQWLYNGMWSNQPYIPDGQASNNLGGGNVFDSGKVAMLDNPSWYMCCVGNLINGGGAFQFGAMPTYNGVVSGRVDADTFRIWKDTSHPDQAFEALSYLVTTGVDKLIVGAPGTPPPYGAVPAITSKQQSFWDERAAQFSFVTPTSWNIMKDGLNYPDVPSAEAWMPNFNQAWDYLNGFGGKLSNSPDFNMENEVACLETDLQNIFNNQSTQGCASFSARFPENEVHGYQFPLGASVTLTIDDPQNGVGVDYTDTQTVGVADWDSNQTWVRFALDAFTLEPGQLVSMTDGITTKTHTVTDLTVTTIDPVADTIAGTAEPGSQVEIGWICEENKCAFRRVITNGSGHWLADFSVVGEDDDEKDLFDIHPGSGNEARQSDVDGDSTNMQWRVLNPYIEVSPGSHWLHGRDWPNGAELTLTIDDPNLPPAVDYTTTAVMGPAPWNPGDPNDIVADFNLSDFNLEAGQVVKVTDETTERTYTITILAITGFDLAADTISGIAAPGAEVQVCVNTPDNCVSRYVTADLDGNWTADYANPGARDDEQQLVDLQNGDNGWAAQRDANGNQTWADWHMPNPNLSVRANDDRVEANEWPLGDVITLEIDDPGTPLVNPDYSDTQIVVVHPQDPNGTYVSFDIKGFVDIQPGFVVSMSDGVTTKTHTVTGLEFTSVDLDGDLVHGVADPNVRVNVWACGDSNCYNRYVTTDDNGNWIADFSAPGNENDEQVIFDIVDGTWIDSSQQADEDGDYTMFGATVSLPTISDIGNQSTNEDTSTGAIAFTIDDPETPIEALIVTFVSSNHALVPNGNITLGGSGTDRTIALMPAANQSGTSTITVTVDDGITTTSDSFVLTVRPVNDPPSVTLSNKITSLAENASTSTATRVATITILDDALGTNVLSLSGADVALFEIVGNQLRLKAGVLLDFETNPVLNVTVAVNDSSVGATPDDTEALMITLIDVDEIRPSVVSSLRANSNPSAAAKVNFTVTFSEPVMGVANTDFNLYFSGGVTGASISSVSGSGKTYTIAVNTGSGNGTIRLDIPVSAIITDLTGNRLAGLPYTGGQSYTINKTLTINSTDTQDGWVLESSENSNKGGTMNPALATFNLGDDAGKRQYLGILSFGTGINLPDNAVITAVTLKVQKQSIIGGGDPVTTFQGFMVDVKNGSFGTAALQTSDFQTPADKSYGPFRPTLASNWYSIDLTSAKTYINKLPTGSGLTQIRLRFKLDDNNNAVANYLSLYSGNAPAASRPQLIIQYYVPVP